MTRLLTKASKYVTDLLQQNLPEGYVYHNIDHTLNVVESANEIGEHYGISKEDMEILLLAAWFHDTGISKVYIGHEEKSIEIFQDFIREDNLPPEKIEKVVQLIKITNISLHPESLLEKIIWDADLSHTGQKGFQKRLNSSSPGMAEYAW